MMQLSTPSVISMDNPPLRLRIILEKNIKQHFYPIIFLYSHYSCSMLRLDQQQRNGNVLSKRS